MRENSPEPVFFDAVLRPNPPLSLCVLLTIIVVAGAVDFAFAVSFVLRGAWPVASFMGADVALLAWAFCASRLAARRREHVTLTASELRVARLPARGQQARVALNPYWVRVGLEGDGQPAQKLMLSSHGRSVQLGSFLAPQDRASLAEALNTALRAAKDFRPI